MEKIKGEQDLLTFVKRNLEKKIVQTKEISKLKRKLKVKHVPIEQSKEKQKYGTGIVSKKW